MGKLAKGVLIFSLLLVAISFFYYYVIFLPQKEEARLGQEEQKLEQQRVEQAAKERREEAKLELQREEQLRKESKEEEEKEEVKEEAERNKTLLDICLDDALETYHNDWNFSCLKISLGSYCSLPISTADRWDKKYKEVKDECFKKYPQK